MNCSSRNRLQSTPEGFKVKTSVFNSSHLRANMEHIEAAIQDFIKTQGSGVFVIKGAWGVGKTYLFNKVLGHCVEVAATKKYSYVSLFGARSIADVKKSILTNCIDSDKYGQDPTITISNFVSKMQGWADSLKAVVPVAGDYIPDSYELNFSLSIDNVLVCLDDLERVSGQLEVREVLGLASELKERKSCKVFLILNDSKIQGCDYETYREKVVDYEFDFSPNPAFGLSVVNINSIDFGDYIKERFMSLNCSNIRVMNSSIRLIDELIPSLSIFHRITIEEVISSIILFCCVKNRSGLCSIITSLDFFKTMKSTYLKFDVDKNKIDIEFKAKERVLSDYGFFHVDEKDLCLIDGISCGFIDKERLIKCLASLDREIIDREKNSELKEAWQIYRSSFDDNVELFVNKLTSAISNNIDIVNFNDLNTAIRFLRQLDKSDVADSLIDLFVQGRKSDIEKVSSFESLFHMSFSEIDPLLAGKLVYVKSCKVKPDFFQLALKVANREHVSDDDVVVLSESPVESYVHFLKKYKTELSIMEMINEFKTMRLYGDTPRQTIFAKMNEALTTIADENLLNTLRVQNLNFTG